eukprot:TRINITY_DN1895_c0_g1_i3.p3 TRINITY_DN1895_c0_g1~~TRINITY_DN1895_c0_g1_i3.p3  ORF type:complete len:174 (+),score=41.01 TRINITY_DN1895_c0_g1_i3:328-849(+)
MEECTIQQASSDDLHLLVHSAKHRQYGIKGAFGMRGTLIPPPELLVALMSKKHATMEAKKAEREVKPVVDPKTRRDPMYTCPLDPNHDDFVFGASKGTREDRIRKGRGERRVRTSRDEVLIMIYDLFNKRPYWTLKALGLETQQPEQFLKEVLESVAVLMTSGEHKGSYRLMH